MARGRLLEARRAAGEGVALDRARFLQRLHRAVDGGERDAAVAGDGALEYLGGVGVALGFVQISRMIRRGLVMRSPASRRTAS